MPDIEFKGIGSAHTETLKKFGKDLVQKVLAISDLELEKESDVSWWTPKDALPKDRGEGIIVVYVRQLLEKPKRTETVIQLLTETVVETVREHFPDATKIECPRPQTFKLEDGGSFYEKKHT